MLVKCGTEGAEVRLPIGDRTEPRAEVCGKRVYETVGAVPYTWADGEVRITVTPELVDKEIALIW